MMMKHTDARQAIHFAVAMAPAVIGWQSDGWVVYSPTNEAPLGVEPELLVLTAGRLPIPLTDIGAEVLRSVISFDMASTLWLQ
jgi:hypothetical protein